MDEDEDEPNYLMTANRSPRPQAPPPARARYRQLDCSSAKELRLCECGLAAQGDLHALELQTPEAILGIIDMVLTSKRVRAPGEARSSCTPRRRPGACRTALAARAVLGRHFARRSLEAMGRTGCMQAKMRKAVENAQLWFIPVINTDGYRRVASASPRPCAPVPLASPRLASPSPCAPARPCAPAPAPTATATARVRP